MGLFKSDEDKLKAAVLRLKDAVYNHEKWGFANTPSEHERSLAGILKKAKKVEDLVGDPRLYISRSLRRELGINVD